MKKTLFALTAASVALFTSCQSDEQETMMNASDEVTVSFGMDFGIDDTVLTRAENNVEYLIAISPAAPVDGKITSGYVGRFTSLSAANATLKANTSYNFYISAYESLGDACDLSSVCATEGKFVEVSEAVSYAPDFADQRVDRYYGTTTETLEGNTTISVEGKRYVYGIKVNIEKPSTGHVTLTSESPALSYNVASNAADAVVEQNIFCLAGTDPEGSKTTLVTVTLFDKSDKKVSSVSKEITIARNHSKTLTVKAIDPLASFDFTIEESELTEEEEDMTPVANMHMGHEYVDLGLPSGLLWATCNVGADSPEDYGDYFAWGETEGYNSGKTYFNWSTYKWMQEGYSASDHITKYTYADGVTSGIWYDSNGNFIGDFKAVLEPADDAAHVNWGGSWRMPNYRELDELMKKCTWEFTTQNGVNGRKVTGPNGNSIFLPAAGGRDYSSLSYAGSRGYYWSSSLYTSYSIYAYDLYFNSDGVEWDSDTRFRGRPVRPVRFFSE